jgi:DNA-binding beta-propeller fold protein YncE
MRIEVNTRKAVAQLKPALLAILASGLTFIASAADNKPAPANATGPYDYVPGWLKPVVAGRNIYPLSVFAQSPDRVFITSGGTSAPLDPKVDYGGNSWRKEFPDAIPDHKLYVVDRNGKVIEDWMQWNDLIQWPHRVRINPYDPEKHVWIIDRTSQQIYEFTNDGKKLLRTLGERNVAGTDKKHFGRPTDIAWLPDGTFYISDGYDNSRVVKFDKNGNYLLEWGTKGTGPGQFNLVHGVTVGPNRHIYVADRDNKRVQIFDENGKFLSQFQTKERPTTVLVDMNQNVWAVEGTPGGRLGKHDVATGKYVYEWGAMGDFAGSMSEPHDISIDSEGAIYLSHSPLQRVDKYVPKPGADKSLLVGQRFVEKISK